MILKTGDAVLIEWEEDGPRRAEATILLASANGRSLMLQFEAILRGCVGMCPLLMDEDGLYRSVLDGLPVAIRARP